MEITDSDDTIIYNDSEDNLNDDDDIVCLELPLAQKMRLKMKDIADQPNNENSEPDRCKRKKTMPEEEALDAFNTWLSQKYEKENNSIDTSTEIEEKQTENELKKDSDCVKTKDKCSNVFHSVNKLHQGREVGGNSRKQRVKADKKVGDPASPTFPKNQSSVSRIARKSKRKTAGQRRHIDIDDEVIKFKHPSDNQVEIRDDVDVGKVHGRKQKNNRITSDSDDDIIEVCGIVTDSSSRRLGRPREHTPLRSRRAKRSKPSPVPLPCTPGGTLGRAASPGTMLLVKQLEDDEMMARQLQEEFDAEQIANSLAPAHGPPILPTFEHQAIHRPRVHNWCNQRYPMLQHHAAAYTTGAWSPGDYNVAPSFDELYNYRIQPVLQNYINMINTPTPPRPRARGRRRATNNRHQRRYPDEFDEQDNGNNYETLMALAERLGPAIEKGLSALEISQLPTFLYTPDCKIHNKSCSICMADYETGDNLRKLPCFHDYHDTCIDQWLVKNPACPICRVEVQI